MPVPVREGLRERPAQRGGAHAPPRHATAGAARARRPEEHRPAMRPRPLRAVAPPRPRVLLTTEGTYPYAVGGVSSWCDLLVKNLDEFDWQVMPIVAPHGRPPLFELPAHARQVGRSEVWSESLPMGRQLRPSERRAGAELPAVLVRGLLGWNGDHEAGVRGFVWCRTHPAGVPRVFRSRRGWASFLWGLRRVLAERIPEAGAP